MTLPALVSCLALILQDDPPYTSDGRGLLWPTGLEETQPYTRLLPLHLNANDILDLAVLRGNHLVAYFDVHIAKAPEVVASGVNDFCVISGGGEAGTGTDALAVVDGSGLALYMLDVSEGEFLPPIAVNVAGWTGAKKVRTAVFGSASLPGLIGIGAAGKKVLLAEQTSAGTFTAITSPFTAPSTVRDLHPLDWDGDPGTETCLAILYGSTLRVLTLANGEVSTSTADNPGDAFAVVHRADGGDCIAWVTRNASGIGQQLRFFGSDFSDPSVSLGTTSVGALVAGDVDGDGDDDLLLSQRDTYILHVVENDFGAQGGSFAAYDPNEPNEVDPYSPEGPLSGEIANDALPAWAPFTNSCQDDGVTRVLDVVTPISECDVVRLVCRPEDVVYEDRGSPTHPLFVWTEYFTVENTSGPDGQLEMIVKKDPYWSNVPESGSNAATHLEVKVWRQVANGDLLDGTDAGNVPTWRGMFSLAGGWGSAKKVKLTIDIEEPTPSTVYFSDCHYVQVRPVRFNGQQLFPTWTTYINAFTMDLTTTPDDSLDYLIDRQGSWGTALSTWEFTPGPGDTGRNAGSVPQVDIPYVIPPGQVDVDAWLTADIVLDT